MTADRKLLEAFATLREDFPLYARTILRIRDKAGNQKTLVLNEAQLLLHQKLENQKKSKGKVRMIVPKSRQQGVSTYTGARFYHRTTMNRGVNTYILAHEQTASEALFGIVERYQKNNPFAPHVGAANVRELVFDQLDSSYTVATAGSKAGGRGKSMTLFHGSEAAFWPNAADHFAASVQTVPDLPGTEIILESTANGVTGEFYERTQDAIAGIGDYEVCFIPWYLQEEYSRPAPEGFELRDTVEDGELFSELEYAGLFGLSLDQMAWRRAKIHELRSVRLFDQEYPATLELAFQQKAEGAYHNSADIMRARKRRIEPAGPLVLGVDPAGEGGDRFAIAFRRGYVCEKVVWRDKIDHVAAVEWLKEVIDEAEPAVVFIDAGGIGRAVLSSLRAKGPAYGPPRVRGVNFGAPSQAKLARPKAPGPKNRRAEMQLRLKEWLALEEGVSIPDMDVLQKDLVSIKIKPSLTNDLVLVSKQEMRTAGLRSPDLADALGLTFADTTYIAEYKNANTKKSFGLVDGPAASEVDHTAGLAPWEVGGGGWMA